MEWIVATIAIAVSLVALWMASSALHKAESQIAEFGNAVRKDLGQFKSEIKSATTDIQRQLVLLDKRVNQSKTGEGDTRKLIKELHDDINELQEIVNDVESNLPPQFRRRPRGSESHINN